MNTPTVLTALSKKIILGSKSPRRCQLMRESGFTFEVRTADTDENFDPNMDVHLVATYLADKKAQDLRDTLKSDEFLVTADSVVIHHNTILNKPQDETEAFNFISSLAGSKHLVITGVCICTDKKKLLFDDRTEVIFENMDFDEIWYYIRNFNPMDKAGAYGIQDWIGLCKVSSIKGSYSNVMGLPIHRVYQELKQWI